MVLEKEEISIYAAKPIAIVPLIRLVVIILDEENSSI